MARNKPLQGEAAGGAVPRSPAVGTVAFRIWSFLRSSDVFPQEFPPKTIAVRLGLREATVRKELVRMAENGQVVNVNEAGWYRAWADPALLAFAERPEPCVHAIQIRCTAPLKGGLGVPRGGRQAVLSGATERGWHHDESNDQAVFTDWIMGRAVRLQASATGTLLVSVSATNAPIRFEDWPVFAAELRATLRAAHGVDLDAPTAQLCNVEFNADWRQFFMGGLRRMKLQAVGHAWGQIYQKHAMALRMELRVPPKELTFKEAGQALVELVEYRARGLALAPPAVAPPPPPDPYSPEVA